MQMNCILQKTALQQIVTEFIWNYCMCLLEAFKLVLKNVSDLEYLGRQRVTRVTHLPLGCEDENTFQFCMVISNFGSCNY